MCPPSTSQLCVRLCLWENSSRVLVCACMSSGECMSVCAHALTICKHTRVRACALRVVIADGVARRVHGRRHASAGRRRGRAPPPRRTGPRDTRAFPRPSAPSVAHRARCRPCRAPSTASSWASRASSSQRTRARSSVHVHGSKRARAPCESCLRARVCGVRCVPARPGDVVSLRELNMATRRVHEATVCAPAKVAYSCRPRLPARVQLPPLMLCVNRM